MDRTFEIIWDQMEDQVDFGSDVNFEDLELRIILDGM
jgi:hypothetical protein